MGNRLTLSNHTTLNEFLDEQRFSFEQRLQEQSNTIKACTGFFLHSHYTDEEVIQTLNKMKSSALFDYVGVVSATEGKGFDNTGQEIDISNSEFFETALKGNTVVSDPSKSKFDDSISVIFATPIYENNAVAAVLLGVYDVSNFTELLRPAFGGKGYVYVTTSTGEIFLSTEGAGTNNGNIFDKLAPLEYLDKGNYSDIKANIDSNSPGSAHYIYNGERRFMHYSQLESKNWLIFVIVPESIISEQANMIMNGTGILILGILLVFVLIMILFFREQKLHIQDLSTLAYKDELTGAINKRKFYELAEKAIDSKTRYVLLVLDIEKFKVLNDTLGYEYGDRLLISMATIMEQHTGKNELFGKGESDHFYLLFEYTDEQHITQRIDTIIAEIQNDFRANISSNYNLSVCAGAYVITNSNESMSIMCDRAKHAQQNIKGIQSSSTAFFSEEIFEQIVKEKDIENRMQSALDNEEFMLYLQPKFRLCDEIILGAEALVRWKTASGGIMPPNDFIPIFEKNGFVTKLDMYMLEKSCAFIRQQFDMGITPVPISINFSRLHLKNPHFVEDIARIVSKYNVSPRLIEIELTESTIHDNEITMIDLLESLHKRGFALSMDDFGSGYSSLGLLKNLSVDTVKLDRTFFTEYTDFDRAKTVISNMITMTRELNINTVAEGVETKENIDLLRELGCDIVQGFYFARPMEALEINKIL
ncbi:MAG: EAL domain-containing protein [Oscillospiraceae bacterium]